MRLLLAIILAFSLQPLEFLRGQAQIMVVDLPNIAALKARNVLALQTTVNVRGYVTQGDGGGGVFEYNASSNATGDDGIVIVPNIGGGRWIRKVAGRDYMARWWGPNKTNSTLQAAIDWVSANGWGTVTADGGTWLVKSDDSTRITIKSGVTLKTAEDSQIVCAPNPADNWILVDFPLDVTDCGVGPARLVGWNLAAPGGDTNKVGLIFSLQDTINVTIGGVKASNWYSRYADVGSNNINLQLFDENWERGVRALGAKGYPIDDTRAIQDTIYYAERYSGEVFFPSSGTNRYLMTTTWVTNGVPLLIKGQGSQIDVYYSQPGDVPNQRLSAAFIIGSHNVTVDGLNFVTVSTNYAAVEETPVTGYYVPINIYLATNTVIKNCTFEVATGKAIASSGSYTVIENNKFLRGCGITFGVGQTHNWLYFANTTPLGADQIYYSPIGCRVTDNYFTGSNAWKHIVFFSAANRFTFSNNKMIDISTPQSPVLAYTGDLGTTDVRGTNVAIFEGTISDNTITGYFGADGAIRLTLATPTNFLANLGNTFDPDTLVSAVTINNNHVSGIGRGIHLIDAKGTKINGGEYRVTRENFFLLGDTDGVEINGGYYETTDTTANQAIVFGNAFLAPGRFRNVKFRNATFLCGANNEYWIRNVIPTTVDSLTVENCDIHFLGAAGSGDAPAVFQLTQSTNYISFIGNRFYLTNGVMDGRRLGTLEGTNCDFTMINNKIIPLSTTAVPRGPSYSGRTVMARGNELRNFEVAYAEELLMSDNLILYGDGQRPVEIGTTGRAVAQAKISGNRILGTNTTSQLAALIYATNATFSDNIVRAFTGSDIVQTHFGRLLVHNNVIRNTGPGFNFPTAALAGVVTDDIYEQPLHIDVPSSLLPPVRISRAGGGAALRVDLNDWFQSFSREVIFSSRPIDTNDQGGLAFFLHHNDGTDEFAFGAEATLEGAFRVGSPTNAIDFYLGPVLIKQGAGSPQGALPAPTPSLYFQTNGAAGAQYWFKTNGVGNTGWEPLTFAAGGGGGAVPTGTGFTHITGGSQDAAAKLVDNADVNAGIDAVKIGGGAVANAEFNLLDGVTGTIFSGASKSDQVQAGFHGIDTSSNDDYVVTLSPAITTRVTGTEYAFIAATANTGAASLNINGTGATVLSKVTSAGNNVPLEDGDIRANQWVKVIWTGVRFQLISRLGHDAALTATSTATLTGKTFDAEASGNVLKTKGYLKFNFPRRVDGVGCTIPNTNDFTLSTFMVPRFNGTGATNDNYCRFAVRVPEDLDTAVVPTASLTVRLTAADTGAHIYNLGFASVANSAVSQATVGTWIKLDIAADASGAADDVESVNNVALTGWNSGLTAQRWWVIELNRAGATDASTVASELLELEIKFSSTQ